MRSTAALSMTSALLVATVLGCNRPAPAERETAAPPTRDAAESPTWERTDAGITAQIESAYFRDDTVNGWDVDVTTRDGTVTLDGSVGSEAQRQKAVALARGVAGVRDVRDQLTVEPAPSRARARETAASTPGDGVNASWITTKIQAQYYAQPSIRPWNIDVTTSNDGTVFLEGTVETEAARREAVEVARKTDGVRDVQDHLRVQAREPGAPDGTTAAREPRPAADAWITTKITSKYFLDTDVSGFRVNVDTRDGVVTLTGDVDSEAAHRQALAIARSTDGVRDVIDQLRVGAEATRGGVRRPARTARTAAASVDDGWITMKIQSKFFLDPDIKSHGIDVDTRNGVVTLSGTIESDEAKRDAEQTARATDGVSRVVNRLAVEGAGRS